MLMKKLRQTKGETLTETLGSLLIIVPAMVMLAGAIVTASKVNMTTKEAEVNNFPTYSDTPEDTKVFTVKIGSESSGKLEITLGKDKKSAYYYYNNN